MKQDQKVEKWTKITVHDKMDKVEGSCLVSTARLGDFGTWIWKNLDVNIISLAQVLKVGAGCDPKRQKWSGVWKDSRKRDCS